MIEEERSIPDIEDDEEEHIIPDLRPKGFTEYVGQKQVVETLQIAVKASKKRDDVLDHVLLYGPPGLGKTTMAHIISNELGVPLVHTSGPALEKGGDLISILTHMKYGNVLECSISDIMTDNPVSIATGTRAIDALRLMENRPSQISILPVIDEEKRPVGLLRLHDIIRAGL